MKNDDLLDLIGKVDDKYIAELYDEDEAEVPAAKHSGAWKHWAGLAACLALIIVRGALWQNAVCFPALVLCAGPGRNA